MDATVLFQYVFPHKNFCYTKVSLDRKQATMTAVVVPRKGSKPICSKCGKPSSCYDHTTERKFRLPGLWGILIFILYVMRRVDCPTCGPTIERVPWGDGKHRLTIYCMLHLARWAKLLSWLDVARVFKTSWDSVYDSVDRVVAYGLEHRNLDGVTSLGVDEIAQGKGHKYLTLVYQITFGKIRLLWIGQGRKITEFNKFFDLLGPERCAKLQFICSDMWPAYLNVIAKRCVNALNILDKFHIVAKLNQAIDTVRRQETRKLRELGKKPFLKHMRWCVLKLKINLTAKEKAKLSGALNNSVTANLQTFKSYLMGQTFQQFWTYTSVTWARKFLRQWTKMVMLSKIEPMKKVARTLQNHEELILNYFRARKEFSSGVVEGLNNKAKTAMRRSYGLKTFKVTEAVLYHTLGQLPEPDIGRKFY